MDGFSKPYRLDRNKNGGGVMIFIRETISSKKLEKHIFPNDVESIFVELNFRKCKWLLCGTYHRPSQSYEYFFNNLDKALDTYSRYDKVFLVGDFNIEISEQRIESFLYMHELCNLVKEKTCFKNMQNPSCIDLLLTNNVYAFQQTAAICTGLSDCHKLVLTVLKTTVTRSQPKEITYRDYKQFDPSKFKKDLKNVLTKENIDSCTKFDEQFLKFLNIHAPLKRKLLRANHAPYISKTLWKAIMRRFYLEKIYFKKRTNHSFKAYKKQKAIAVGFIKKKGKTF